MEVLPASTERTMDSDPSLGDVVMFGACCVDVVVAAESEEVHVLIFSITDVTLSFNASSNASRKVGVSKLRQKVS